MEVADWWRSGFGGFKSSGFVDGFQIWDLGLVVQIYDLVVSNLILVVGFVFGFSGSTLRPLNFASTRIDYPYLWFRIWVFFFFHLRLFVLGVCVDGGKRIGLLLVLLKMDWWVCVCILAGFVFVFLLDLSTFVFVFVFLLDLCLCSCLILGLFSKKKKRKNVNSCS